MNYNMNGIFYFSSTGNSLFIAEQIKELEQMASALDLLVSKAS